MVSAESDRDAWARGVRGDVLRGEFDSVDSLAARFRREHARWDNGWLKLGTLYYSAFGDLGLEESDEKWRALVRAIAEWRRARPQSLAAPVALAYAYTGWAWYARGDGWASTVSDEEGQLFTKRLLRAEYVLGEALRLGERDPYWYAAMQTIALGEGWARETYDSLYTEGVAADPQCWILHKKKAAFLLPRWYGEPGEWEEFALAVSNDQPDSNRTALYAEIVWYLDGFHGNVFDQTDASWYRAEQGFDELLRRHPGSLEIASEYAKLASFAGDRDRAKEMFQRIGLTCDLGVWKTVKSFHIARNWALTPPS